MILKSHTLTSQCRCFGLSLNIASIICLILCVALLSVWVRSYSTPDMLTGHFGDRVAIQISSRSGRVVSYIGTPSTGMLTASGVYPWSIESYRIGELTSPALPYYSRGRLNRLGFAAAALSIGFLLLSLPYRFLVLTIGSLAMSLRIRPWRFTPRSLFIATTFLAVVLGMIAWLDRAWIGK